MKSGISANPCRVWRPNVAKILDKVLNNLFTTTNFQKKKKTIWRERSALNKLKDLYGRFVITPFKANNSAFT